MTIYDVARYCGVSKSTVSRVLNNSSGTSEEVRSKVVQAVKILNYRPHGVARGLVLKRSNTVAVVVQDIRNPFYAFASWYAERCLRKLGYGMVIYNADNDATMEKEILELIAYRRADGVLSIGGNRNTTSVVNFHLKEQIPVVVVDREIQGYEVPTVNLDNRAGGMLATDHLLDLGHERIVFATSDFNLAELHRKEGYLESLQLHGYVPDRNLIVTQSEKIWVDGVCHKLVALLDHKPRPTAVFASNDFKAIQVISVLRQHGLAIPDDMSVVGYDDIYLASTVFPGLTTIRQPLELMIEAGVQLLADIVLGRNPNPQNALFTPELVVRQSTKRVLGPSEK